VVICHFIYVLSIIGVKKNKTLDSMILTLIPTIIGEGIPLFPDIGKDITWNLTNVEKFETGVVNLTYERK
jgi:dihydrofolate reductase